MGPIGKFTIATGAALWLAGCATTKVEQRLGPSCEGLEVTTKTQAGQVVEQFERITGFDEDCARFRLLALAANAKQDSEIGQISSVALMTMLANENQTIRDAIKLALVQNGIDEKDLQLRAAQYQIPQFAQNLNTGDGRPNMLVYAALVDAYQGNKYPDVDAALLQPLIEQELQAVGTSYGQVARRYQRHLQNFPVDCKASTPTQGQLVISCENAQVTPEA